MRPRTVISPSLLRMLLLAFVLILLGGSAQEAAAQSAARIDRIIPAAGKAGDKVTIDGIGFGASNVVIFVGGVRANVLSANGHTATFVVPAGLPVGQAMVVATNPGGRSGSITFTILAPPMEVFLDTGAARTMVVPRGGGTVNAVGSNGISYALTIPPEALDEDVEITLTPIASIANFHLPGGTLAAAQLQPEGLRFRQVATLSLTLPGPPAPELVGRGLQGFVMKSNGGGFEPLPFIRSDSTFTLPVMHFSDVGVGAGVCGATTVTSTAGRNACQAMSQALSEAYEVITGGGWVGLPEADRIRLASTVSGQLRAWLQTFITPAITAAADTSLTNPAVDQAFNVAFRELQEVGAIVALYDDLDLGAALGSELRAANDLAPQALTGRRTVSNVRCLAERARYREHVTDVIRWTTALAELGFDFDSNTLGVTCLVLTLNVEFPAVIPAGGAEMRATAQLEFADHVALSGTEGPGVRLVLSESYADATRPLQVEGEFGAVLVSTVAARNDEPSLIRFSVQAYASNVGLSRRVDVERCRTSTSTSSPRPSSRRLALAANSEPTCQETVRFLGGQVRAALLLQADTLRLTPQDTQSMPADASGPFTSSVPETTASNARASATAQASTTATVELRGALGIRITGTMDGSYRGELLDSGAPLPIANAQGVASATFEVIAPQTYVMRLAPVFSNPSQIVRTTARILQGGVVVWELASDGELSGQMDPGIYTFVTACAGLVRTGSGTMSCGYGLTLTPQ